MPSMNRFCKKKYATRTGAMTRKVAAITVPSLTMEDRLPAAAPTPDRPPDPAPRKVCSNSR